MLLCYFNITIYSKLVLVVTLEEGEVLSKELGQVDVPDGPQQQHTLILVGIRQFQVT